MICNYSKIILTNKSLNMKNELPGLKAAIAVTFINFLFLTSLFAQAPDLMSYQAVIRDSGGDLVRNSQVAGCS